MEFEIAQGRKARQAANVTTATNISSCMSSISIPFGSSLVRTLDEKEKERAVTLVPDNGPWHFKLDLWLPAAIRSFEAQSFE